MKKHNGPGCCGCGGTEIRLLAYCPTPVCVSSGFTPTKFPISGKLVITVGGSDITIFITSGYAYLTIAPGTYDYSLSVPWPDPEVTESGTITILDDGSTLTLTVELTCDNISCCCLPATATLESSDPSCSIFQSTSFTCQPPPLTVYDSGGGHVATYPAGYMGWFSPNVNAGNPYAIATFYEMQCSGLLVDRTGAVHKTVTIFERYFTGGGGTGAVPPSITFSDGTVDPLDMTLTLTELSSIFTPPCDVTYTLEGI